MGEGGYGVPQNVGVRQSCKDGKIQGWQRYLCRPCSYRYTVAQRSGTADHQTKRTTVHLHLEGLGFRSIGRILHYCNVAVLNWIKAFGEQLEDVQSDAPVPTTELDELHSYVMSKKPLLVMGCC
jgi:transposase